MMNEREQRWVVPIFEKDGNRFFICHEEFVGADEEEAWKIGVGASLVEGILWGMRHTGETLDVTDGIPHCKATLCGAHLPRKKPLISGPLFDEVSNEGGENNE